jgi:MYXO-CTERM domain-containing protein
VAPATSCRRCGDGDGPFDGAGGAGGCSVQDSGGGGAHFGAGGRGTTDCFLFGSSTSCQFPQEFEQDCGNTLNAAGTACTSTVDCREPVRADWDGLPTVAGQPYRHSIYEIEFGAAGGDKGCRDNDGFGSAPTVGGPGGGRVVLVALNGTATATIDIDGTIDAGGRRGCGSGNDSGGGGAGGSVLIVGDQVDVGATARVSAAGGLGGDTFAGATGQPDFTDCPSGSQTGGTCDDCGGGGGGGIVNVISRSSTLDFGADFDVSGADGGVCAICRGEAGGGAGELLLDGAFVGELCDGYDNDFDGLVDEGLGTEPCGLGACETSLDACTMGVPTACSPATTDPSCIVPGTDARPRIAVILDTSSSMLLDLDGFPTFGDGSVDRPGLDVDGNGQPDDSRLFLARNALAQVISAYPEIDFALARYHQDQGLRRSCQTAKWFECEGLIGTYDDPTDNTGDVVCTVDTSPTTSEIIREVSNAGDECINYAGTCGPPRRGGDVLSGFGTPTRDLVRWLDGREDPANIADETPGNYCDHLGGGDCEVRASGQTPLAGSLEAVEDYLIPIRSTDGAAACRTYGIILVTDGAESCGGDPEAQARRLFDTFGIETFVIAVSVLAEEEASLNAIASAGSGATRTATFVRNPADLVPALTAIVSGSLVNEECNGVDDDCDGLTDEGFPVGEPCDDGGIGGCRGTGALACTGDGLSTECVIDVPGAAPSAEVCNGADDNCNGVIDEGLTCTGECVPTGPEVCNGLDDDCNGARDEADPMLGVACGESEGACEPGALRCVGGMLVCIGGTQDRDEVCNGIDDDCDGVIDDDAPCPDTLACIEGACRRPCNPAQEFPCPVGFACEAVEGVEGSFCLPTACALCQPNEICVDDTCVDPCEGVSCDPGQTCVRGRCVDCRTQGCSGSQVCFDGQCIDPPCRRDTCPAGEACVSGTCQRPCAPSDCAADQRCAADGGCEADPCADVSCDADQVCVEGSCRDDACDTLTCEVDEVCTVDGGCVPNLCLVTVCPAGRACETDERGVAICAPAGVGPDGGVAPRYVVAAGGRGCAVDGGGPPHALGWLLLVGLVLRRRRSRR